MIEVLLFIFKYKIKKNKENLALHCKEFFKLSNRHQRKVLDIYFKKCDENFEVGRYFNNNRARYYQNNQEVSFFNCYYFCKKIIDLNINNLVYIDKFQVSDSKIEYLINYSLNLLNEDDRELNVDNILNYPGIFPKCLSQNIEFMNYVVSQNAYYIKYMTYNGNIAQAQRELIKKIISKISRRKFDISKFFLTNNNLPKLLIKNIDFIIYITSNDINNIKYLDENILNNQTATDRHRLIKTIIKYLSKHNEALDVVEENQSLALYLNKNYEFLNYIIDMDVNNIIYVDWHNIVNSDIKRIIDFLALKLVKENIDFDCEQYSFKNILKQNYMFMAYLIDRDKSNIKEIKVVNKDDVNKLVDIYLNKYKRCKFDINNYLGEDGCVNNCLVENRHMLSYLIRNDNKVFRYIDFLRLSNSKEVVEVILKEMDKDNFEFDNDSFLRNNKYPIPLSNNYRFMRYVIDKNFNNLAYIDISMIDDKELRRIINYAFRMVYYIRGNNKKLNFDLEGYFKNSSIVDNDYFKECLRSL